MLVANGKAVEPEELFTLQFFICLLFWLQFLLLSTVSVWAGGGCSGGRGGLNKPVFYSEIIQKV